MTAMNAEPADAALRRVTFVLHTRNRPDFLSRCLDHFEQELGSSGARLVITDGSDPDMWAIVEKSLRERGDFDRYVILHSDPPVSMRDRLAESLARVETDYVALAADDDFYFKDWIAPAAALLDSDGDFSTVYGHALFFYLEGYRAYGEQVECWVHPRTAVPQWWQEHETPAERLQELNRPRQDTAFMGWYALQRTAQLRAIFDLAVRIDLRHEMLEHVITLVQTITGKTRMLDTIFLARQEKREHDHRFPTPQEAERSILDLTEACLPLLMERQPMAEADARKLLEGYFAGPRFIYATVHKRRALFWIANRLPIARTIWQRLRGIKPTEALVTADRYPDHRFPPLPKISDDHPLVRRVRANVLRPD